MTNSCILYTVKFTAAVDIFSHFMPICHSVGSVGMWLPTTECVLRNRAENLPLFPGSHAPEREH